MAEFHNQALRDLTRGPDGFLTQFRLSAPDLQRVKRMIEIRWLERLAKLYPKHVSQFEAVGLERYYQKAHLVDHGTIWPKEARYFSPDDVEEFCQTSLFSDLEKHFGLFEISDEDRIGWEEVYWRLVRPNEPDDVGPMHAERWFTVVGDENIPADREQVKVWIAIVTEPGRNGLSVVPGSHLGDWRFHGEMRHGKMKPMIDEDAEQFDTVLVPTKPGDAIVFSQDLLHQGVINTGSYTRVSLEFTMLVRP